MFRRERREDLRLKGHCLLKYKTLGSKDILCFARNISCSGVLFHVEENVELGTELDMQINFPPHPEPIKVKAKVVRVKPLKKVGGFDVGVEFIEIDEKDRDVISKAVLQVYGKVENQKDKEHE